jgi:hypothetical protein
MHWSECKLALKSTQENSQLILEFTQPLWGIQGHLCTVYKRSGESIFEGGFIASPDGFTRFVFSLMHGLRGFIPLASIRSNKDPRDAIRFYECHDRRGKRRRFVYATESNGDGGGSFIVCDEDFDKVFRELRDLEPRCLP